MTTLTVNNRKSYLFLKKIYDILDFLNFTIKFYKFYKHYNTF